MNSDLASMPAADGARFVRESGYDGCVELCRDGARVILEPNTGGRVLGYAVAGTEVLWRDPAQDGLIWNGQTRIRHLAGGRFDIGPEYGGLARDAVWLGRWTAEIIGSHSARLTSAVLPDSGLQLVREFTLGARSHLRCTQNIHNRGPRPLRAFHWGRTFVIGGGVVIAPLPAAGRFPRGYTLGGPLGVIDYLPKPEPMIRIRDGLLEILGPPLKAKFNFDVDPGWLAYLAPNGLLFVKKFPVFADRPYGELAANNASVWYRSEENTPDWPGARVVVELEPIGPLEVIEPGGARSFTEDWWLVPFPFPADREADLNRVVAAVEQLNQDEAVSVERLDPSR